MLMVMIIFDVDVQEILFKQEVWDLNGERMDSIGYLVLVCVEHVERGLISGSLNFF